MSDLIFRRETAKVGDIAHIILNRPQVLNAIKQQMFIDIHNKLIEWQSDDKIKAVLIYSNCDKAFSAGGDIRSIYEHGKHKHEDIANFFKNEYKLNLLIHNYQKPYIALINGITMGGGAGLAMHAKYVIAKNDLKFAMPETKIGFFPDAGISYYFSRCPNYLGLYLALSGCTIDINDAIYAKLIKYKADNFDKIFNYIHNDFSNFDDFLKQFKAEGISSNLMKNHYEIIKLFSNIENAFEFFQTKFNLSPASLRITYEQIKRAKNLNVAECLQNDSNIVKYFLKNNDFFEGIRAFIIDKDKKPIWRDIISNITAIFNNE